jgi:hypothetical protein
MRLTDHVTLNCNSNTFIAAVFLDIERVFDNTWHSGLLYKLSKFKFSTSFEETSLTPFFHKANAVFRWKTKCLRHGKYKHACLKVVLSPTLRNMYAVMKHRIYVYFTCHEIIIFSYEFVPLFNLSHILFV